MDIKDVAKMGGKALGEQEPGRTQQRNERETAQALAKVPREIKERALAVMRYAIAKGELVRPDFCGRCGKAHPMIHGHHRSYEPHMWLLVEWLCPSCHRKAHRQKAPVIRKTGEVHCRYCKQVTHICPAVSATMAEWRGKRKSRKGNPRVLEALAKARAVKGKKEEQ